ncbi:MAG: hypothetical protein ACXVB9_15575 [Bdellovibrionota bacterium]
MFGRRGSLALLLILFVPAQAHARNQTFLSGTPFGLGLVAAIDNRPNTGFVAGSQTSTSNYSSSFAVEPFFDLVNVCFRLHAGWHFYPLASGAGSDSHGTFTESSDAGALEYGARILLAPLVGTDMRSRFYFVVGVNDSIVKLKNSRKYTSGTMLNQVNVEQLSGSGTQLSGGLGVEFFLVQNYSLALEAGYSNLAVSTFHYGTSTDSSGATVTSGATATDGAGNNKGWHNYTPYGQLVLNLNL